MLHHEVKKANKTFFNATASLYNEINVRVMRGNRNYFEGAMRRIRSLVNGDRFLDVGCGSGHILSIARMYFKKIYGIDIAIKMLKTVRPTPALLCADACGMPFKDESFDAVSCHAVLHHIYDYTEVLKESRRVLKKGGILYIDHELDRHFLRCFWPLVALYRIFWGMDKRYLKHDRTLDISTFKLAEYHTLIGHGIDIGELKKALDSLGFEIIQYNKHCYGASVITNRMLNFFNVDSFPLVMPPFFSILAKKR